MEAQLLISFMLFIGIICLYIAYCRKLIKIAEKLKIYSKNWLLYIPFANGYILYQMAGMKLWTFIITLIPLFPYILMVLSLSLDKFIPILAISLAIPYIVGCIFLVIVPYIWSWKIAKRLGYSGWWSLIFPLWILILDLETEEESKTEKESIEYAKTHKKKIEEKEDKNIKRFFRDIGIILAIIILAIIIQSIFFK